jgi:hypothetical protein
VSTNLCFVIPSDEMMETIHEINNCIHLVNLIIVQAIKEHPIKSKDDAFSALDKIQEKVAKLRLSECTVLEGDSMALINKEVTQLVKKLATRYDLDPNEMLLNFITEGVFILEGEYEKEEEKKEGEK